MLYDPKWEQKTATPSLEGFIGWLETQDPLSRYNFCEVSNCAVTQYLRSINYEYDYNIDSVLGHNAWTIVVGPMSLTTFGRALKRARNFARTGNADVAWTWKSLFKIF